MKAEYKKKKLELYLKLKKTYMPYDIDEYSEDTCEDFFYKVHKGLREKHADWSVMRDVDYADMLESLYTELTYVLKSDVNNEGLNNKMLMDMLNMAKQAKKDCLRDIKKAEEVLKESEEIIKICEYLNAQ